MYTDSTYPYMSDETIDCEYCDKTHHGEKPHLKHLKKSHYDDLKPIDKRRVDETVGEATGAQSVFTDNIGGIVVGSFVILGVAVIYVTLTMGGGTPDVSDGVQTPGAQGAVHEHAPFSVSIDGETVDFSQSKYQVTNDKVHFEGGDGSTIHFHAPGATIAYILEAHSFTIADNGETLSFNGETYSVSDGDTIQYRVDGESVNPYTYELEEGERIRVIVESAA